MNLLDYLQQMTDGARESYDTLSNGLVGDRVRNPRDQEVVKDNALALASILVGGPAVGAANKGLMSYAKSAQYTPEMLKLSQNVREAAQPLNNLGLNPLQQRKLNLAKIRLGAYGVALPIGIGGLLEQQPKMIGGLSNVMEDVEPFMKYARPAAEIGLMMSPAGRLGALKPALDLSLLLKHLTDDEQTQKSPN